MRIKNLRNHWILISVVSVVSFILLMRSIRRPEPLDLFRDGEGKVPNKAEQARVRHLEVMVDDLQKQLWDAQRYEKQLIEQLKNINAKPVGQGLEQYDNMLQHKEVPQQGLNLSNLNVNFSSVNDSDLLGCREINRIKIIKTVGKGFSKIVQEGQYNGMNVAVKSAGLEVKDVQDCLKSGMYKKEEDCFVLASYKVLKEAMMLKQLKHKNIVRLLGLCLRSEKSSPHIQERGMTVVVELGEPVRIQDLAELPYPDRVGLCASIAKLLLYLAESPLGSVAIRDFREEQFVLIDKQIKLSDVDDLSSSEPDCNTKMQCLVDGFKTNIKCASNMKCPGLNAKTNLRHAYRVFFEPFLGFEVPPDFVEKSQDIMKKIRRGAMDTEEAAEELSNFHTYLVENWKPPTPPMAYY